MSNRFDFRTVAFTLLLGALAIAPAAAAQRDASSPAPSGPAHVLINAGGAHALPLVHSEKARYPSCGVQFTYTLSPNQTALFYTFNWAAANYIDWTVMNDTANSGNPAVSLSNIATQNAGSGDVTYWLTVENLTSSYQAIEGRFCYLG